MPDSLDLTSIISQASTARTATSVDPETVTREQNVQTDATMRAQQRLTPISVNEVMGAMQQQQQRQLSADQTRVKIAEKTSEVTRNVRESTSAKRENLETVLRGREGSLQEHTELVSNANYSFFRNPVTYVRDQYRISNSVSRLNRMAEGIQAINSDIQVEYSLAAQELRAFRETEIGVDWAVKQMEYNFAAASAQQRLRKVDMAEQAIQKQQQLSQQRKGLSDAQSAWARQDQQMQSLAEMNYFLRNETMDGFNAAVDIPAFSTMFQNLTPEERRNFSQLGFQFHQFRHHGELPANAQEFVLTVGPNEEADAVRLAAWAMVDGVGFRETLDVARNIAATGLLQQAQAEWIQQNQEQYVIEGNKIPSAAQRAIDSKVFAQTQAMTAEERISTLVPHIIQDRAQHMARRGSVVLNEATAAEFVEMSGHPPEVVAFFQSDDFKGIMAGKGGHNLRYGDVPGTLFELWNSMKEYRERSGAKFSDSEIAATLSDWAAMSGAADYAATGKYSRELGALEAFGLLRRQTQDQAFNFNVALPKWEDPAEFDRVAKSQSGLFGNLPIIGEVYSVGKALGLLRSKDTEFNIADPTDTENLMHRIERDWRL